MIVVFDPNSAVPIRNIGTAGVSQQSDDDRWFSLFNR